MYNILKMVFNIKDVIVDKISLISRGKRPAVARAETSFSIFKTADKKILSPENMEKLDQISKAYNKKTLYVARPVKNGKEIIKWAKKQWLSDLIKDKDLHVTIAFSKKKVNWDDFKPETKDVVVDIKNAKIEKLWDALVIKFTSKDLEKNWKKYVDGGASWDYKSYMPHISLSYNNDQDISKVETFSWKVTLWKEIMDEIKQELLNKLERISKQYDKMIAL